jgi:ABC-type phosphate transport system substrate-binding protein
MPVTKLLAVLALVILAGLAGIAQAEDGLAVITGPTRPAIAFSHANLQDIFLKRIQVDDNGNPLVALNLPPDEPLREAFSQAVLGRRPGAMQRYWTEQYFHGISPPFVVHSPEAMLRFVAETPGAIGYVALCQVDKRVQLVTRLPVAQELAGRVRRECENP